jgi:hypothetical protein
MNTTQLTRSAALVLAGLALTAALTTAQTPSAGPVLNLTATTDNVAGAHDSIRIDLFRWSTDAERDQLMSAWMLSGAPATGRGAGGRGRGAAAGGDDVPDGGGAPAAGGRAGRGGRGGGAAAARQTPESSLKAALGNAPTVGYLWSSEVAGYSIRYAARLAESAGGERIILITDRRLGESNNLWKPTGSGAADAPATAYEFSLIELRLNAKSEGEGKISLTGKVAVDSSAKTIALENYSAMPVVLKDVKRRTK